MTENRRIALNVAATYGRSLFALACGVFGGRWALMSLGEVDYGLQGLVGGLTGFIGFFNGILATSMSRFYALAVGRARVDGADGLEECRRWFSIAVLIHTAVPIALMAAGWPIGEWAVRHFLTIPPERIDDCIWVFRFSCVGCLVGMTSVPFHAMYGAKQYIAELTVYGFVTAALNIGMLYFMVSHPSSWLVRYSLWLTVLSVAPSLVISARSVWLFPECRLRLAYCLDRRRIGELLSYAFWMISASLADLMRGEGVSVLANKYFGPAMNAALAVARNVNGKACELGNALSGAFTPAITSAYGEGDLVRAHALSMRVCRFGMLASLFFVLPLATELHYVLRLWLVHPPEFVEPFCYAVMAQLAINRSTRGHMVIIQATGRIALYKSVASGLSLMMVPVAWLLIVRGFGAYGICIALVAVTAAYAWCRPFFAQRLTGLKVRDWIVGVMLPICFLAVCVLSAAFAVRLMMPEGFVRLATVVGVSVTVFVPIAWSAVLDRGEREYLVERFVRRGGKK